MASDKLINVHYDMQLVVELTVPQIIMDAIAALSQSGPGHEVIGFPDTDYLGSLISGSNARDLPGYVGEWFTELLATAGVWNGPEDVSPSRIEFMLDRDGRIAARMALAGLEAPSTGFIN